MLTDDFMEELAGYIDIIDSVMNIDIETEAFDDHSIYSELVRNLIGNLEFRNRRTGIESGGKRVSCRLIEVKLTKEAILSFLNDVYVLIENNESTESLYYSIYGNPMLREILGDGFFEESYEHFLKSFKEMITNIENTYLGDIVLSFYIAGSDRLLRTELNADIEYNYSPAKLNASFDFGSALDDDWAFDINIVNIYSNYKYRIDWLFEEKANTFSNTIIIDSDSSISISLTSEWNLDTGDFVFAFIEGPKKNTITGLLATEDENFHLILDDVLFNITGDHLALEVSTRTGASIDEINYINLDNWGPSLILSIMRMILGGIFS